MQQTKNFLYSFRYPIIFLLGIFIVINFSKVVPYCMDEFSTYHPIICNHYPFNKINAYRENCRGYDLNLLNSGIVLPLRAYQHIGSFPSLLYYPIFLLWKSPLSARFLGIIFIFLQSALIGYIFNLNKILVFFILLLFFPYIIQHIIDTGQIGYQTTSIFLIYYLINKWYKTLELKHLVLVSLSIFLGIWTKLSYFCYIPGILIIFGLQLWENKENIFQKKNILRFLNQLFISLVVLLFLLYILFFSTYSANPSDKYLNVTMHYFSFFLGEPFHNTLMRLKKILGFILNPYSASERIYDFGTPSIDLACYIYDAFIYLSIPLIIYILWKKKSAINYRLIGSALMYFAFALTVFAIARAQASRHMHHAILSFPFLILSASLLARYILECPEVHNLYRSFMKKFFVIFVIFNLFFFLTFSKASVSSFQDESRNDINAFLYDSELAKRYFYVVVDWGMYYYQGLYGPKEQSVIYMEPLSSNQQIDELRKLKEKYNRKLLFIYNSKFLESDLDLIQSSFKVERCMSIDENAIWQILIEDNEKHNYTPLESKEG